MNISAIIGSQSYLLSCILRQTKKGRTQWVSKNDYNYCFFWGSFKNIGNNANDFPYVLFGDNLITYSAGNKILHTECVDYFFIDSYLEHMPHAHYSPSYRTLVPNPLVLQPRNQAVTIPFQENHIKESFANLRELVEVLQYNEYSQWSFL